jgi:hypothetical protein
VAATPQNMWAMREKLQSQSAIPDLDVVGWIARARAAAVWPRRCQVRPFPW